MSIIINQSHLLVCLWGSFTAEVFLLDQISNAVSSYEYIYVNAVVDFAKIVVHASHFCTTELNQWDLEQLSKLKNENILISTLTHIHIIFTFSFTFTLPLHNNLEEKYYRRFSKLTLFPPTSSYKDPLPTSPSIDSAFPGYFPRHCSSHGSHAVFAYSLNPSLFSAPFVRSFFLSATHFKTALNRLSSVILFTCQPPLLT